MKQVVLPPEDCKSFVAALMAGPRALPAFGFCIRLGRLVTNSLKVSIWSFKVIMRFSWEGRISSGKSLSPSP